MNLLKHMGRSKDETNDTEKMVDYQHREITGPEVDLQHLGRTKSLIETSFKGRLDIIETSFKGRLDRDVVQGTTGEWFQKVETAERRPHQAHAPIPPPHAQNPNHPSPQIFSKLWDRNHFSFF